MLEIRGIHTPSRATMSWLSRLSEIGKHFSGGVRQIRFIKGAELFSHEATKGIRSNSYFVFFV